ncbi:MAG TPA: glycosyl hydrolase 53 family protein [Bryobacteraceae bacterium]|nr:glycosyl hydrolase 53 family protein [Bryobacteraceae bacterium]
MNDGLVLTSDGSQPSSQTSVYSQYYAPGDFDVQVNYELASSWSATIIPAGSGSHFQGASFTIYFDGQNSLTLFRYRDANSDQLVLYGTVGGQTVYASIPSSDVSGTLRIVQTGTRMEFMALVGGSWTTVGTWIGPVRQAVFALGSGNVNSLNSVTTTFTNFTFNSGATNFEAYQLPNQVLARPDFLAGFDSATESAFWELTGYHPYPIMAANGLGLAHIRITTVNSSVLQNTPFEQWETLPYDNSFWSSQQVGGHLLAEAQSLGMQNYLEMFLSDQNADAGVQNAPAAWQGLSVADTATQLQNYTYQTVQYYKSQGIAIGLYGIGNEIGLGIENFLPGQLLPAPQGASPYEAVEFMEQNVWPTEATLLKAAIAGVKMADPNAKIALHIEGLGLTPADVFVRGFFSTMVNLGVPFDAAALSLPYMQAPGWTLPQYTFACWAQRMDAAFRDIAALGKKGMIAEGAYQNSTVNISLNAPMSEFPVTPQGQAAWIDANLRFASNNPNVVSFNYFYPEYYYGYPGEPAAPPLDVEAYGLFQNPTTIQPGMLQFNPFLNTVRTPQINAVVNLANSQPGPVAPGEYAIAYGANLAGFTVTAQQVPYLASLADVAVTVNGQQAPVQYVSATQINFLVPYGTSTGPATVVISAGLQDSLPFTVQVQTSAPAIFMYNGNQAIAQDVPSLALNGPSAPAAPGSAVTVYIVGLGATSPTLADGVATPTSPYTTPTQTVTATIAGQNANVLFAGLTPQLVGLGQVNLSVPQGLAQGTYSLVITIGNQTSSPAMLSVGTAQ